MIFTRAFDIHSITHFIGCYALVPTLIIFGMSGGLAVTCTLLLAIGWEALDEFNSRKMWRNRFLDPRGADVLDLIVGGAGILLAILVF